MADQKVNNQKRKKRINFYKFVGKVEDQKGVVTIGNDKVVDGLNNVGSTLNGLAKEFEEFKTLSAKNFLRQQKIQDDNKKRDKPKKQQQKKDPFGGMVLAGIVGVVAGAAQGLLGILADLFKMFIAVAVMRWMSKPENREKLKKIITGLVSLGKFLFNVTTGIVMTTLDLIAGFTELPFWKEILKGGLFLIALGTGFLAFKKLFGGKAVKLVIKTIFGIFKGFWKSLLWFSGKLVTMMKSKGLRNFLSGRGGKIAVAALTTGALTMAFNKDGVTGKDLEQAEKDATDQELEQEQEIEGLPDQIQAKLDNLMAKFDIATEDASGPKEGGPSAKPESIGGTKDAAPPTGQETGGPQAPPEPQTVQEFAGQKVQQVQQGVQFAMENPQQALQNTKDAAAGAFSYAKTGFGNIMGGKSFFDQGGEEQKAAGGPVKKKLAGGGLITGPQTGYPVSLDGGKSTSFIGHGTEMVHTKPGGSAFVVPYDTPATRGNKGLTARRQKEAANSGYFSQGGPLKRMIKASSGANIDAGQIDAGQEANADDKSNTSGAKVLSVPYFNQRANKTDSRGTSGDSQCFSTSAAMVISAVLGKTITPDEYNVERSKHGNSTSMGAHPPAMKKFGVPASAGDFGSYKSYKSAIDAGKPVILGLQHNSGSGHMVAGIGYRGNDIVVNDPWGKLNPTPKGGWASSNLTSAGDTKGKGVVYPKSLMDGIWVDRGPGTGRIVVPGKGGAPGGGSIGSDTPTTGQTSQDGNTNATGANVAAEEKEPETVESIFAKLAQELVKGAHAIGGGGEPSPAQLLPQTAPMGLDPELTKKAFSGELNFDVGIDSLSTLGQTAVDLSMGAAEMGAFGPQGIMASSAFKMGESILGGDMPTFGEGLTMATNAFAPTLTPAVETAQQIQAPLQGGSTTTLDPTKTAASMPHVFEAARQARAEARAAGKSAEEVEQLVIKASEEAKARGYSQGGQVQGQAYRNNAKKLRVLQDTYRTALSTPVGNGFKDPRTGGIMSKTQLMELKAKYERGMKLQKILSRNAKEEAAGTPISAPPPNSDAAIAAAAVTPQDKSLSATLAREDAAVTAALSQNPASMMKAFKSQQPAAEVVPAQITKPAVEPQEIKPAVVPQPVKQQAQEVVSAKGEQKQSQKNAAANVAAQTERQNAQASKQVEAMSAPIPDKPVKVPIPKQKGGGNGMSADDVYNYRPGFGLFSGGF
jgi:hypothetical protein